MGNEVIKNLTLFGVGSIYVCDFDRIELSNLTRSVLFREEDAYKHAYKVEVAAKGQWRLIRKSKFIQS